MSLAENLNKEVTAESGGADERNLDAGLQLRGRLRRDFLHDRRGQSLLETALLVPLLMTIIVNAVSIGYCFSVYLNMATAPTRGAQYSVTGTTTVLQTALPGADSVSSLVYDNITGAIPSAANTPTRVCTVALGLAGSGSSQTPNCANYGTGVGTFSAIQADPEAPYMLLNRVDIQYTVVPLIQGSIFNLLPNSLTLHRTVVMRAIP